VSLTKPRRRRSRRVLSTLLAVVLVVVLVVAGVFGWTWYNDRHAAVPAGTPDRPAVTAVTPAIAPVDPNAPEPADSGVARALRAGLRDKALGELTGMVSDPLTGQTLWSRDANTPRTPASNAKILTASAALLALDGDARLTTTVVLGADGTAVLVGGGDPTLSAQPAGEDTFYTSPARIADLADQIRRSGARVTSVAVAPTTVTGDSMAAGWDEADIKGGDITPIESLTVDGGRLEPLDEYSPRSATPAIAAGQALAAALDLDTDVAEQAAPPGARTLARVTSAPLSVRVGDMMRYSDNVLAESLAIELSTATGGPASIEGGAAAVLKVLGENGFDVDGTVLHDASGLSTKDLVPARLLDALVSAAAGDARPRLRPLLDTFPVAHGTGTLAERFDPDQTPGAGWVRAKTGTLTGVTSLTGIVQTVDGRVLAFALMSGGTSPADARPAVDALVGALRECGCRD